MTTNESEQLMKCLKIEMGNYKRGAFDFPDLLDIQLLVESDVRAWIAKNKHVKSDETRFLIRDWHKTTKSLRGSPFPFPESVIEALQRDGWLIDGYQMWWEADSGASAAFTKTRPLHFILQTPNDGGSFCSMTLSHGDFAGFAGGIYVASEEFQLERILKGQEYPGLMKFSWSSRDFMILPVLILENHVKENRDKVEDCIQKMSELERDISQRNEVNENNLRRLFKDLNQLRLEYQRLSRRSDFETTLGRNILEYFDGIEANENVDTRFGNRTIYNPFIRRRVLAVIEIARIHESSLGMMPQRIESQTQAVNTLISQTQNKRNIEIKLESSIIADNSRRDSASMKTISILTLIFLPPTYVASLFSTSMFNWQAGPDIAVMSSYLWVYFVVTIPLTVFVMLAFRTWFQWQEKKTKAKMADRAEKEKGSV